ncbi:4Fe-4S dicluster domain-containing protein [Candidatus Bathyarchaeota archaeon]|nr:4Fe-4S dicluster domain-containing protein [Candidatus Bathyarchaeota archaeon]
MVSSKQLLKNLLDEEKLGYCQHCGMCTASCPLARVIPEKYNPRTLLQRIHLGPEKMAESEELWLCAWCYRCTERCPQGIQPTEIFLLTRNFAIEKGIIPPNPRRIIQEIIRSGRSMPYDEFIDELREDYGLPPIGEVPEGVLEEQRIIMGDDFIGRVEK